VYYGRTDSNPGGEVFDGKRRWLTVGHRIHTHHSLTVKTHDTVPVCILWRVIEEYNVARLSSDGPSSHQQIEHLNG
jgi:hypothetical protein